MFNKSLILFVLFSFSAHAEGILVRFRDENAAQRFIEKTKVSSYENLLPALNIYLFPTEKLSTFATAKRKGDVLYAHPDYPVQLRSGTRADDPLVPQQWSLNKISAFDAWSLNRGGPDVSGNDVVVAVVDGGFDVTHEDLRDNVWTNLHEIPNNRRDDDGNGYIDDVHGWDVYTDSGVMERNGHATHVAGIIGASGMNALGIAGVVWHNKMISVHGGGAIYISNAVKAFGYVIAVKKLWLDSHGAKGANIVVDNSSFGVDLANCAANQYKVWNDLFNAMGALGILTSAATTNNGVDVDRVGDIPTGCSSPYIVAVTNTDQADGLNSAAGYGLRSIDLGAPGEGILSTLPNNRNGMLSGTSMSAPHITATIALMHSAASRALNNIYRTDPARGALIFKELLLNATDKIPALAGKTVTGGRLNVYKAVKAAEEYSGL